MAINSVQELTAREHVNLPPIFPRGTVREDEFLIQTLEEELELHDDAQKRTLDTPPGIAAMFFLFVRASFTTVYRTIAWCMKTSFAYLIYHPSHAIVLLILLSLLSVLAITGSSLHKTVVMTKISDSTINSIIEGSRFTREFRSDDVTRKGTYEFLRVGAPTWIQEESIRAILHHARMMDLPIIDQAVLLATVEIESGFNPMARAQTTTACGLFQFVRNTGVRFGLDPRQCMDPWKNAEAGVSHYLYNYKNSVAKHVRSLEGAEKLFSTFELSYYLHHDGPNTRHPGTIAKSTVLNGAPFLFKAYEILSKESENQVLAPSFADSFTDNLWRVVNSVMSIAEHPENPIFTGIATEEILS